MPARNDNAEYLIHRSAAFAGKPRSYGIWDIERAPVGALFLWAPDGLSSGSPAPPLEPGVEQGITDDHQ